MRAKIEVEYRRLDCKNVYEAKVTVFLPAYYKTELAYNEPAICKQYVSNKTKLQNDYLGEYWGNWSGASDYRQKSVTLRSFYLEKLKLEVQELATGITKTLADVKAYYVALPEKQTIYLED